MSDIEFKWIGWCNTTESDGTKHDKVWVAFNAGGSFYAGWAKRGKALSFKLHTTEWSLMRVKNKKDGEYKEVDAFQLFVLFPDFEEEVSKRLTFCTLAGKIK